MNILNQIEQLEQLKTVTWDGDLIDKSTRNELVKYGYAVRSSKGWNIITPAGIDCLVELKRLWPKDNKEEMPRAVCPFGKTRYDSSLLEDIYRVRSSNDGGTILSAYWNDGLEHTLKHFKAMFPLGMINNNIKGQQIGALCGIYDWKEIDIDEVLNS